MSNGERVYTIKLTEDQFRTTKNCLSEFERMTRQKLMRKIEQAEHIPPEVLNLLASLGEVNDLVYEEHIRIDYLGEVSARKQC